MVFKNGLNLLGVLLGNLLSVFLFLALVDSIERDTEVSEESVGGDDSLLLGVDCGSILFSDGLTIIEFCDNCD